MILLDENIRQDQAIQLRRWHIPARFLAGGSLRGEESKTQQLCRCFTA
jgi:hypothetical protein